MGFEYSHHSRDSSYFSVGWSLQLLTFGLVDDSSRPRTMSFVGSEDYIRAQFEDYTLALLSSVKYDNYLQQHSLPTQEVILPEIGITPQLQLLSLFVSGSQFLALTIQRASQPATLDNTGRPSGAKHKITPSGRP